jgi:hypothetical protein
MLVGGEMIGRKATIRRNLSLALIALGFVALALSLTPARPARAMGTDSIEQMSAPRAQSLQATSGAAALFGLDEGGVLAGNAQARAIAAAVGAPFTRVAISWAALEPTPGTYNFAFSDGVINGFLNDGFKPVVYIADNPKWASPDSSCGPVDTKDPTKVAAFANIMGQLAARYKSVKWWSAFNEIDNTIVVQGPSTGGCFGDFSKGGANKNGVPDHEEYAIMLAAAWQAVHAANPDPEVRLAAGALAFDNFHPNACPPKYPGNCAGGVFNYNFVSNLYNYIKNNPLPNGQKYFDTAIFNYYEIYGRYWETVANGRGIQSKADMLRKKMKAAGIPVTDLLVTETGEDSLSIGLKGQARCLDILLVRGAAAKLKGIIWWTFRDFPDNAPPPSNTWKYGVVDQNLQPKPAYTAMQVLVEQLNGFDFNKNLSGKSGFAGVEAYRFKGGGDTKIVVWSSSIRQVTYAPDCSWARHKRLATFKGQSIKVVGFMGNEVVITDNSKKDKDKTVGRIAINVNGNPRIVELNP